MRTTSTSTQRARRYGSGGIYFDVYERHLGPFREQAVHVVEIGVFGGGSLRMWRDDNHESFHSFHAFIDGLTPPLHDIGIPEDKIPATALHQHVHPYITILSSR